MTSILEETLTHHWRLSWYGFPSGMRGHIFSSWYDIRRFWVELSPYTVRTPTWISSVVCVTIIFSQLRRKPPFQGERLTIIPTVVLTIKYLDMQLPSHRFFRYILISRHLLDFGRLIYKPYIGLAIWGIAMAQGGFFVTRTILRAHICTFSYSDFKNMGIVGKKPGHIHPSNVDVYCKSPPSSVLLS
jgi:hypothetical protein